MPTAVMNSFLFMFVKIMLYIVFVCVFVCFIDEPKLETFASC